MMEKLDSEHFNGLWEGNINMCGFRCYVINKLISSIFPSDFTPNFKSYCFHLGLLLPVYLVRLHTVDRISAFIRTVDNQFREC